jgi:anthranilate synthase/aminodeoxychorismate synthase-like glutamine amidotransferase
MICVIDNYDSFVYNIVQALAILGAEHVVCRNDQVSLAELERTQPTGLVISPGPGAPAEAGISKAAIGHFAGRIPILGVCLGHQCIGEYFGARVRRARRPMHGKLSTIFHDGRGLMTRVPAGMEVVRYHSLVLDHDSLPDELEVTALAADGEIMGVRHRRFPIESVQFHPESIFTHDGVVILENFYHQVIAA